MSRFIVRFENHPLHNSLENIFLVVNELLERDENLAEAIIELDRIKQVCTILKTEINNCDPNLVHIGYLDNLHNNCINTVSANLAQFRNDRNISYLQSANNHLDSYLPSIANLMMPKFPLDLDGIRDSIVSFRRSASQHLRHTEEEYKKVEAAKYEIEQSISSVASTVEIQKSRLDAAIAEFQQQFSQTEEARRQQYSNGEEDRKKEFEQMQTEWAVKFTDLSDDSSAEFNQYLDNFKNTEKGLIDNFNTQVKQYIDTLDDYKNKAAKILNVISNTSMAGGYKQEAEQEKKSRKFWRTVTMIAMGLLVGASIWGFVHPIENASIWAELAKRISVAATFATVAGYSARQAKIHLDAERVFRRMELELTSLSPYLIELEEAQRQEVLAKMAEQFFGKANTELVQNSFFQPTQPTQPTQPNQEVTGGITELTKLFENILSLINTKKQ